MDAAVAAVETDNVLEFDPHWCLFWGKGVTGFHLDIWMPYLRGSRYRYAIMAGEDGFSAAVRDKIASLPNCVILEPYEQAKSWLKLCPSFRGFLYIGTKAENFRVVNSFGGKQHIWLGHGESDKVYNAFRTASLYDSMFLARYEAVRRYPRAIRRWVAAGACAIGTPILDGAVKDPWTRPRPIRSILYAPTWEGHSERADYQSLESVGPALINALPELTRRGITVVMRPHPSTGARRPELRAIRDAIFEAGAIRGSEKAADFGAADIMLSDISGVTAEFLFTEKPTIMPVTPRLAQLGKNDDHLAAEYPWVYRWNVEREPLLDRLAALEAADPLQSARAKGAREMFRGHRSLEEAVATFDLALDSVRWRKTRIPVRWAYELKRAVPWLGNPRLRRVAGRVLGYQR